MSEIADESSLKAEDIFGRAEVESEGAPKGKDEQVFYHVKWWTGFVKDIIRQLDTMFDCDTFATCTFTSNRFLSLRRFSESVAHADREGGPLADEDAHHVALGFLSMWASPSSWRVLPHVKECRRSHRFSMIGTASSDTDRMTAMQSSLSRKWVSSP
jgi:hypothetical protein